MRRSGTHAGGGKRVNWTGCRPASCKNRAQFNGVGSERALPPGRHVSSICSVMVVHEAERPAGRLIVITQGARWPSWLLRYRDLGPGDAIIAHDNGEPMSGFLNRATSSAAELSALGVAPHSLFLCLPESDEQSADRVEDVARALVSRTGTREVVLVSAGSAGARDGRRLHRLQRALKKVAKHLTVRVEAPRLSARKVAHDAALSLVHRLNPGA